MGRKKYSIDGISNEDGLKEDEQRDQWSRPLEFMLSCLAMSVGLGNVWRFPFVAYQNGGGAFLIPYLIVLLLIGKPLYYLEMCIGQFASRGCVAVWNMAPAFRGIGYGQLMATICVASYYVCLVARVVFYLFASMSSTLPWKQCDSQWPDVDCEIYSAINASTNDSANSSLEQSASLEELYLRHSVLKSAANIDNGLGAPDLKLTFCLLFSWIIILLALIRGVKSQGKVAYFTALFPYLMLFIILGHSLTLEGSGDGIIYFLKPDWAKLIDPTVWYQAVVQCFFSLSVCFGSIIMFSSYNRFNHPIARDAAIISIADMMTSFLAGLTIFSVCGSTAHVMGTEVPDVIKRGKVSLPFVIYPMAISTFKNVPQLFAVMFFLMQLTLGIGSAMGPVGCIATVVCDRFPNWNRTIVTLVICSCGFLVGLIYVTPGGDFMLALVDYFGGGFVVFALATLEVVAVCWVYGVGELCDDVEVMTGRRPGFFWRISWVLVVPVTLLVLFIYNNITMPSLSYDNVQYPMSALVSGWMITIVALSPLVICFAQEMRKHYHLGLIEALKTSMRPNSEWGPLRSKDRDLWRQFKGLSQPNPPIELVL